MLYIKNKYRKNRIYGVKQKMKKKMTDLLHFDRKKRTKINVHFFQTVWRIIPFFFEKSGWSDKQ